MGSIKGQIRQQWGKLTDDDVERIHGEDKNSSVSSKKRYGRTERKSKQVADFLDSEQQVARRTSLINCKKQIAWS